VALMPEAAAVSANVRERSRAGTLPPVDAPELRLFVMGLFFIFGGITSLT